MLCAASGLLLLIHKDLHAMAARLIAHLHLNPASKYPHIFLDAASDLQNTRLSLLALGAGGYSDLRFIEAYGLFRAAAWAEVLAAASAAIYLPFEIVNLFVRVTWLGIGALAVNIAVVVITGTALIRRRSRQPI